MKHPLVLLLITGIVVVGLVYSMREPGSAENGAGVEEGEQAAALRLYCAASNRAVVEAIRQRYEAECGRRVEIEFGPSQTLLSSIEVSGQGDLYLPADDSYLTLARERGIVRDVVPLASMRLAVCVPKGNPAGITTLRDLMRRDVRLVQAQPDAAAVGKLTHDLLAPTGLWEPLRQQTIALRSTVTEVANDVKLGAADAGIVFDAVLSTYPELEAVFVPELDAGVAHISVGVVARSSQPARALHLARYLAARDRGQEDYARMGFTVGQGDLWADEPKGAVQPVH